MDALLEFVRVTDVEPAALVTLVGNNQVAGPDARFLGLLFGLLPGSICDLSIASSDRRVAPYTVDRQGGPSMPRIMTESRSLCACFC